VEELASRQVPFFIAASDGLETVHTDTVDTRVVFSWLMCKVEPPNVGALRVGASTHNYSDWVRVGPKGLPNRLGWALKALIQLLRLVSVARLPGDVGSPGRCCLDSKTQYRSGAKGCSQADSVGSSSLLPFALMGDAGNFLLHQRIPLFAEPDGHFN
jgi:hypothetical protein